MKKRILWMGVLLTILLELFGCSAQPVYEYTQEHSKVNDLCGGGWLVNGNLAVVTVDHNTYRFDNDISEDTRRDFINSQQELCQLLRGKGIPVENYTFFVLTDIVGRAVHGEQTAYMNISLADTYQQVLLTLQAVLGEYTNYGYVYALSDHISRQLDWKTDVYGASEADCFRKNVNLLNLVYPCFDEKYADEEERNACKAFSRFVLSQMSDAFAGEQAFMECLQRCVRLNNADFAPTYLGFAFGGGNCPLKLRTNYLEIFLSADYEGSFTLTSKTIREDPMLNLDSMIEFWEYADKDIYGVRTSFRLEGDALMPVYIQPIYDQLNGGGDIGGFYTYGGDITLAEVFSITHEYAHYADYVTDTNSAGDLSWCDEVLACYYGKNMEYATRLIIANSVAEDVWTISDLSYIVGQRYDSVEDEILLQHILTSYEENYHYSVVSSYSGRLSFGVYFVETYGEDVFIQCMQSPNAAPMLIGRTVDDVVDDWCLWLEQFRVFD